VVTLSHNQGPRQDQEQSEGDRIDTGNRRTQTDDKQTDHHQHCRVGQPRGRERLGERAQAGGEQEEDDGGGWVVAVDEEGGHRCGNVIRFCVNRWWAQNRGHGIVPVKQEKNRL